MGGSHIKLSPPFGGGAEARCRGLAWARNLLPCTNGIDLVVMNA